MAILKNTIVMQWPQVCPEMLQGGKVMAFELHKLTMLLDAPDNILGE